MLLVQGTGGIPDVVTYLKGRLDIHRRIKKMSQKPSFSLKILEALDNRDLDTFMQHLTEDVEFRFGSDLPVKGYKGVKNSISLFLGDLKKINHSVESEWEVDSTLIVKGMANYHNINGRNVCIPFCDIWTLSTEEKIKSYQIYCDPRPMIHSSQQEE